MSPDVAVYPGKLYLVDGIHVDNTNINILLLSGVRFNRHNVIQTYHTKIAKYLQLSIDTKAVINIEKISTQPCVRNMSYCS